MEAGEPTAFAMTITTHGDMTLLTLQGTATSESLLSLRDTAFTVIGSRPRVLCVDAQQLTDVDIALLQTFVTISRVARLVQVQFCLDVAPTVAQMLRTTGLWRMLPSPPPSLALYNEADATKPAPIR